MAKMSFWIRPITLLICATGFLFVTKPILASDLRVFKVAKYLKNQDSPLVNFAPNFIAEADKNKLDYRMLVAISGVESTFGKFYLDDTYNAYGWGGGLIKFSSWPEGIASISADLKTKYVDKGAKDIYQIGRIYCPPNSANWSSKVQYFMDKIENTEVVDPLNLALDNPNVPRGRLELPHLLGIRS